MPSCTDNCAKATPSAGQGFIFRGGDNWHFGNSSAAPYTGGTWTWAWSGTSSTGIYIGVDQSWYSGASWARPVLTGDNPLSTSAVSSCPYQSGSSNVMMQFYGRDYYQFDNFEMTGLCEKNSNLSYGDNAYIGDGTVGPDTYSNIYIHGWTHLAYSCSGGSGFCFGMYGFVGAGSEDQDVIVRTVIDGSDSDPTGIAAIMNALYDVHQSVFIRTANILGGNCHTFHDNYLYESAEPGDNNAHGNIYECNGEASVSTPNTFYNNVIGPTYDAVGVGLWPEPAVGATDYYFNNVMWGTTCGGGNCVNIGQNGYAQGALVFFNNTFQNPSNTAILQDNGTSNYSHQLTTENNLWITNASNGVSTAGSWTSTTDLTLSQSTATNDGYTSSQTNVFFPTSSSDPTVGHGTNVQSTFCTALAGDSSAYAACQKATTYGVTYNATNHTVGSSGLAPAEWSATPDIGAYQF